MKNYAKLEGRVDIFLGIFKVRYKHLKYIIQCETFKMIHPLRSFFYFLLIALNNNLFFFLNNITKEVKKFIKENNRKNNSVNLKRKKKVVFFTINVY